MNEQHHFLAALTAFVGVDGCSSLGQAALRPDLPSRSSIRTHLKDFDDLLERKVTEVGVKRTAAGELIAEDAKRLLEDLAQNIRRTHEHLKRLAQIDRPVGVAMSTTIWDWALTTDKLPIVNALPGHASAEFLVANSSRVEKVVRDGLFEIGVTVDKRARAHPDVPYKVETFDADEIVVFVPPSHEWEPRQGLKAADLAARPVIALDVTANARQIVESEMERAGFELASPLEETATAAAALQEAIKVKQPALLPEIALASERARTAEQQGFKRQRVKDLKLARSFCLMYQAPPMLREDASETVTALRELLENAKTP